jgi:hypothetical protein
MSPPHEYQAPHRECHARSSLQSAMRISTMWIGHHGAVLLPRDPYSPYEAFHR